MNDLIDVLQNQKEVKYLTYFVTQDKVGLIKLNISAAGVSKKYKFKSVDACLSKIIDILLELRGLEAWSLRRLEKEK